MIVIVGMIEVIMDTKDIEHVLEPAHVHVPVHVLDQSRDLVAEAINMKEDVIQLVKADLEVDQEAEADLEDVVVIINLQKKIIVHRRVDQNQEVGLNHETVAVKLIKKTQLKVKKVKTIN